MTGALIAPWQARQTKISDSEVALPESTEKPMNPASASMKVRFRPSLPATQPVHAVEIAWQTK